MPNSRPAIVVKTRRNVGSAYASFPIVVLLSQMAAREGKWCILVRSKSFKRTSLRFSAVRRVKL